MKSQIYIDANGHIIEKMSKPYGKPEHKQSKRDAQKDKKGKKITHVKFVDLI